MSDDQRDPRSDPVVDDAAVEPEVDEVPPEPPKARSVLMDILERAKKETESETARLMDSIREREEEERRKREEDERRKAEEARRRVEEERRKREAALREFEERHARKEAEAKAAAEAAKVPTVAQAPVKKSRAGLWAGVGVAGVAAAAVVVWLVVPKGEPVAFPSVRLVEVAKPGRFVTTPAVVGPGAEAFAGEPIPPERLVLAVTPRKYEPKPPKPAGNGRRVTAPREPAAPQIRIQTGILGGKKVVK